MLPLPGVSGPWYVARGTILRYDSGQVRSCSYTRKPTRGATSTKFAPGPFSSTTSRRFTAKHMKDGTLAPPKLRLIQKIRQRRSLALPKRLAQTSSPFRLTLGLADLALCAARAYVREYAPRVKTAAAFPSTPLRTGLDEPFGEDRFFLNIPSH